MTSISDIAKKNIKINIKTCLLTFERSIGFKKFFKELFLVPFLNIRFSKNE